MSDNDLKVTRLVKRTVIFNKNSPDLCSVRCDHYAVELDVPGRDRIICGWYSGGDDTSGKRVFECISDFGTGQDCKGIKVDEPMVEV